MFVLLLCPSRAFPAILVAEWLPTFALRPSRNGRDRHADAGYRVFSSGQQIIAPIISK
jgi:hypothetical protein